MIEATPVINEILWEAWMQRGRIQSRRSAQNMRWVFALIAFGVIAFGLSQV